MSIVMPTFNRAALLRETMEACLSQTHTNLELIIVDDGSTDATPAIVGGFTDPRVVYLRHDHNRGLPEALNTGFRRSTGAYLSWGDDDDLYAPTAIAELVQFLEEHPDIDFAYADVWIIDAHGAVLCEISVCQPEDLVRSNGIGACRLFRRAVYEAIGDFNPDMYLAVDYDYWLRVAQRFRMVPLHRPLGYYRVHEDSMTGRVPFAVWRMAERVRMVHGCTTLGEYRRIVEFIDLCEAAARGQRGAALRGAGRAVVRDRRHLTNPRMYAMLLKAVVGTTIWDGVRTLAGRPQRRSSR